MSINHVTVSGNLVRDAELKQTSTGLSILSFRIACNERRKNAQGDWEDYANFLDCIVFGKYGESIAPYMAKGTKVVADGALRQSSWEKDGQKRSKVEIIASEVELPPKPKQGGTGDSSGLYDESIPF